MQTWYSPRSITDTRTMIVGTLCSSAAYVAKYALRHPAAGVFLRSLTRCFYLIDRQYQVLLVLVLVMVLVMVVQVPTMWQKIH
jgi:hypothetical protein